MPQTRYSASNTQKIRGGTQKNIFYASLGTRKFYPEEKGEKMAVFF